MHALCVGEDASVEDRAVGPEDIVQRVRREVQIRQARAGVQARGEPDLHADSALQLSSESPGTAEAEGNATPTTTATAAAARDVRTSFPRVLT